MSSTVTLMVMQSGCQPWRRSWSGSNPKSSLPPLPVKLSQRRMPPRRIPIVTAALADAVHLGLIASEARPGGNVTGITPYVSGLPAKQLELAREIVPGARRIGVLNDINDPKGPPQWEEPQAAGRLLEVSVTATEVRSPDDL